MPRKENSKPEKPARPQAARSLGVVNAEAIYKPVPPYPPTARELHVSGVVKVLIVIDKSGKVISARSIDGNPLLAPAAQKAAYQVRFSPALLSGIATEATGTLTYNFVLQ